MDILFPNIIRVPGTGDNGVGSLCEGGPTALAAIPLFTVLIYAEFDDPVTVTFPTLGYLFLRLTKGLAGHTQHIQQRVRNLPDFCIAQTLRGVQNLSNLIHAVSSNVTVFLYLYYSEHATVSQG